MRHWIALFAVLSLAAPPAAHAEIYKRVLPDGTVVYSDEPHPEAEEIEPPPIQVVPTPPRPPGAERGRPEPQRQQAEPAADYAGLRITAPATDEVIWDDQGDVTVRVAVDPQLHVERGHRLVVLMDGERVAGPATDTVFALDNVFRGSHTLRAEVRDSDGETVTASPPVTFHIKQHSILFPKPNAGPNAGGARP